MNLSSYISEYLNKYGKAEIFHFGTFYLKNSKAIINPETGIILPPTKRVAFAADYKMQDGGFINYVSKAKNIPVNDIIQKLDIQTEYWKKRILAGDDFQIEPLGRFLFSDEEVEFQGSRIDTENPDFYGLETINLSEIKGRAIPQKPKKSAVSRFGAFILWMFLVSVPVAGLIYLIMTQQDLLSGKKNVPKISITTSTHRIEESSGIPADSLIKKQMDSAISDSLNKMNSLQKKP